MVAAVRGEAALRASGALALNSTRLIKQCYRHRSLLAMPWMKVEGGSAGVNNKSTLNSRRQTVGILGANGFVGSRIVEIFHLNTTATVRPIVRTISAMARCSRFALDIRVADGFDFAALRNAIDGLRYRYHAIAGDRRTILGTLTPVYRAAAASGVKRLVYLSTASVHGQAPAVGSDEGSVGTKTFPTITPK